ncbi:MAG TPA: GxxExxY protein [Terriglobales bacterium]|jgi:GxxExxY protein|nr:GxxExxY protein [Terriglobales bacterium]
MTENEVATIIVDAAVTVHRDLGPGLLESVYEMIMVYELEQRGLRVRRQMPIVIRYKEMTFDAAFRADLVVEEKVIVELKSVEQVNEAHKKQVQTYLRLSGCKLGFLLNFGEALMKRGISRVVNGLEDRCKLIFRTLRLSAFAGE